MIMTFLVITRISIWKSACNAYFAQPVDADESNPNVL